MKNNKKLINPKIHESKDEESNFLNEKDPNPENILDGSMVEQFSFSKLQKL